MCNAVAFMCSKRLKTKTYKIKGFNLDKVTGSGKPC